MQASNLDSKQESNYTETMKTLAIVNRKGGVGKTTLAVNLASILGQKIPTVLVDADPQGSADGWLPDSDALPVVHAPDSVSLAKVLGKVNRAERGLFVIDCPPLDPKSSAVAMQRADLVLIPVIPSPLDIKAVAPLLEALAETKAPALVVLNLVKPRTTALRLARETLEEFGVPIARTMIGSRVTHAEAAAQRLPVTSYAPRSAAAQEMNELAREVKRRLEV